MGCTSSRSDEPQGPGLKRKFTAIADNYETFEELQSSLRRAGLESSSLIVAVDYTKSNTWTGEKSFQNRSLHYIDPEGFIENPYQSVIRIVGRTLEAFDDDKLIPVFGFGDVKTGDKAVFPFNPDGRPCNGFQEVLSQYNAITPTLHLSGPTNFAPAIREAIKIVSQTREYHILVIIADGQVTNEEDTRKAIVEASNYPLSIIVVGVGDGPWEMMREFDDSLPARRFDNMQFVEFNKTVRYNAKNLDVAFALAALMEIPEQYKAIRKLGLL